MNTPVDLPSNPSRRRWPGVLLRLLLGMGILGGGVAIALALVKTSPKVQRKPPAHHARLVEVQPVRFTNQPTRLHAMGTVQPAREVELRPRVAGEIIWVSDAFIPGGRCAEGEPLLRIDPTDYILAVRQRESDVTQAEASLKLEQGQQTVALNDYALLGEVIRDEDRDFVLRKPQLEQVRARLQAAQAALAQAQTNLDRTTVRSPFNAVIRTRNVNLGVQVSPTSPLAALAGTDEYWVMVTVPVGQLRWILIPDYNAPTGSVARVYDEAAWGKDSFREGRVVRLLADLEKEGRMAQLLVAVQDPLALQPTPGQQPRMILGDYVRVEMDGRELESVVALDRDYCRDGDNVWLLTEQNCLEIRPVQVAFRGRDQLLVSGGLKEGERLVVTDLSSPVAGMPLRTMDQVLAQKPERSGGPGLDPTPSPEEVGPRNGAGSPAANGTFRETPGGMGHSPGTDAAPVEGADR